ncbi:MAG: hypothetical protein KDB03_10420 [Planctomycetales bacterium]|nr:hypothetical protein [Planctomycetales bacterium]
MLKIPSSLQGVVPILAQIDFETSSETHPLLQDCRAENQDLTIEHRMACIDNGNSPPPYIWLSESNFRLLSFLPIR